MNKVLNRIPEVKHESSDTACKLYRLINEISRQLDDHRARAHSVRELFRESIENLRVKLRDYCDKLMFTDPVQFGKKAEDFLWKKSFYEVVTTVKHVNKKRKLDECEKSLVYFHLESGIGHYHHLIMKLQSHFGLDLRGSVDFPLMVADNGLKKDKSWWSSKAIEMGGLEWSQEAVVRSLIYLGDLSRYLAEYQQSSDHTLTQRYYMQALSLKPECGMPHNQLGTLYLNYNWGLDSTYHYMRSICCMQKFEGTEANFNNLFEKNVELLKDLKTSDQKPCVKNTVLNFISLSHSLFYDKPFSQAEVHEMFIKYLEECFNEIKSPKKNVDDASCEPDALTEFMVFKMVVILIMCVKRLKDNDSALLSFATSVCIYVGCLCLDYAVYKLNEVLPQRKEPSIPSKGRRRRRRRLSDHSDISDDDSFSVYSSDSEGEEGLIFDQCNKSDDEFAPSESDCKALDGSRSEAGLQCQPWNQPFLTSSKTFVHVHNLSQYGYILQTIKILFDWFSDVKFFMKRNGVISSTDCLVANFICFMNHLTLVPSLKSLQEYIDEGMITEEEIISIPLPEDIQAKGLPGLKSSQSRIDWNKFRIEQMPAKQQTYIRIRKLVNFGINLASILESPIGYNEAKEWFSPKHSHLKNGHIKEEDGGMMKNLAEVWLKSEVVHLEQKTKKTELPAYLVLDASACLLHPALVRQLALSKCFVIIIPTIVLATLDDEKHKMGGKGKVRDITRWIENQMRHGSRFIRTQRPNEHTSIPFIKYPKKKDKDSCVFIEVVECAYFLSNQSTGEKNGGLVTLLTGSLPPASKQNGFSPVGVAKSAGINVEFIDAFFGKWKASSKSHG